MTQRRSDPEHPRARAEQAAGVGALAMTSRRDGDEHVLRLDGELDIARGADVEREIVRIEQTDVKRIVVDLSGLTFIDSTGVRILLQAEARSRADSCRLTLLRPPASVGRVFVICGVDSLLPFSD
ncbi:MAG: anti-sigma factor antagonist [Solirubrobacteraceae bacterium]|jgi:anti-anti-sigma factor|nr:anti-sigma factor antagonist [Solirubrobacteraceae bacterium]